MEQDKIQAILREGARRRLLTFARVMKPSLKVEPFHKVYYEVLDRFAHGKIKRLIIQQPPQHGKSEGSSRFLPAFMFGINPTLKICIGSYSATIARDFNKDVQRIIDTIDYQLIFPDTKLSGMGDDNGSYTRNLDAFDIVGTGGYFRAVGRGGALTSKTIDVSILDDVYKDYAEANSPIVREASWKWYSSVVRTRLHNDSQELIVFTRWHKDDIIGKIEESEEVIDIREWADIEKLTSKSWARLNFEAIKESEPFELDPREKGQPLWADRHSLDKLEQQRELDPMLFECLYQGNPESAEGRLYQLPFKTYSDKEEWGRLVRKGAYIDVADEGSDMLFCATYEVRVSNSKVWSENKKKFEPLINILITDMEATEDNTDVTTITIPMMINRNSVEYVWVEANAGGALFEKTIRSKIRATTKTFHQTGNKEARIITASALVNQTIIMPFGWETRYEKIHQHVTNFLRNFKANKHDDPEDGLTGIYEKEVADGNVTHYFRRKLGVTRRN